MKKTIITLALFAIIFGASSCQKENLVKDENTTFTITATFDEQTKVAFAYDGTKYTPSWQVGDNLIGTIGSAGALFTVASISGSEATLSTTSTIALNDVITLMYIPGLSNSSLAGISAGKYTVDVSAMSTDPAGLNLIMTASAKITGPEVKLTFANKTSLLKIGSIAGLSGTVASKVSVIGASLYKTAEVDLSTGVVTGKNLGDLTYSGAAITTGAISTPLFGVLVPSTTNLQVYVKNESNNLYLSESASKTFAAGKCYSTTRTASSVSAFSVSATKRVLFAPGNLQYAGGTFNFAAAQNSVVGYSVSGQDLFSWSTDNNTYRYGLGAYAAKTANGGAIYDWGNAVISNWAPNFWHTLSSAEWNYLLNTRTGNRFAFGKVGGVSGIVVFKDGYVPAGSPVVNARPSNNFDNYSITLADLILSGNAFLPCTGLRYGDSVIAPSDGLYWSSTYVGLNSGNTHYVSYVVNFNASTFNALHQSSCSDGAGVRLVHEL